MSPEANRLQSDPAPDPLEGTPQATIRREIVRASVACCGEALRAIILTGSLARNEGTFVREADFWRVWGDAEFILILHERARSPKGPVAALLRREIENGLAAHRILCPVDLSIARPGFLRALRPHVFAYELKACGQVIWGDPQILTLIAPFESSAIPLEDGWRLLQNRLVELLGASNPVPPGSGPLPDGVYYRTAKLYLDMATSLLVFLGSYAPTYSERERRLRTIRLSNRGRDLPFDLAGFSEKVSACTQWKLHPFAAANNRGASFWETALQHAHHLWRWELLRLTGLDEPASDHDLLSRWTALQPLTQRLRGWGYAVRQRGWLGSRRDWAHWCRLALTASPRYCTYAVADDLLFGLASLIAKPGDRGATGRDWEALEDRLPLRRPHPAVPLDCNGLAAAVWRNYTELVMGTRA